MSAIFKDDKRSYIEEDINTESDVFLANEGYITIVPISLDQTNYDSLDKLKNKN